MSLTCCCACCADFASGVYHWAVDNYGSSETPVFGSQIAGFQVRHPRIRALSFSV